MGDFLTKAERSHRMSLIRSKDTVPEKKMAELLRKAGIKYKRYANLPGTPDFVAGKVVLFVDGDFWHGRDFDRWKGKLSPWWREKIATNKKRDARINACLRRMGFSVVHFWEKDVKRKPDVCITKIKRIGERNGLLRRDH
jgi:DNA mismatch endonuclease (patch repair protein)